jgi:fructan beta-fructosidase
MDYGRDNYAGVTWSDVPQKDGRRILIGWMSNWQYAQKVPTEAWRSAATLPRVLSLQKTTQGYRLISEPVKELKALRVAQQAKTLTSESWTPKLGFKPTLSELEIEFEKPRSGKVSLVFSNTKGEKYSIGYDSESNQFFSDRSQAGDHSFSKEFLRK